MTTECDEKAHYTSCGFQVALARNRPWGCPFLHESPLTSAQCLAGFLRNTPPFSRRKAFSRGDPAPTWGGLTMALLQRTAPESRIDPPRRRTSESHRYFAELLEQELDVRGVAVVVEATHTCMTIRGVRNPGSLCVTSAMRGKFRENASSREEVMHLMMDVRK